MCDKAREAVEMRAQIEKKLAQKEKEKREENLRQLAQKAREERAGIRRTEGGTLTYLLSQQQLKFFGPDSTRIVYIPQPPR